MRIFIITQNETLFIKDAIEYFIRRLPDEIEIVGAVVFESSPFGSKKSFLEKVRSTISVFGLKFFIRYGFLFVWSVFFKSSIAKILSKNSIPVIDVEQSINAPESLEKIRNTEPDLLISLTGNKIFKKPLIELSRFGILNLHTALLPKYRGLMPTFWAMKNRENETGVSVFFVDEGIDSGPIVIQKKLKIGGLTQDQLIRVTKFLGVEAIIEAIQNIKSGNVTTIPNNDEDSSYFTFPTRQDVKEFRKNGARFF